MKADELKRPDLAHTSCALCDEAWQSPDPPDMPEGYFEAVEYLGQLGQDPHAKLDVDAVAKAQRIVEAREAQALAYQLDEDAFAATRDHADTHPLDEHLAHAHLNRIPLTCEKCGLEAPATQKGVAALKAHDCPAPRPRQRAYPE